MTSVSNAKEPTTVNDVLSSPDKTKLLDVMKTEIDSLHRNDVWDLVELPKDRKAVGSKLVFKVKCRWICGAIQSSSCCSGVLTEIWH